MMKETTRVGYTLGERLFMEQVLLIFIDHLFPSRNTHPLRGSYIPRMKG
jgi:hypothetical protein